MNIYKCIHIYLYMHLYIYIYTETADGDKTYDRDDARAVDLDSLPGAPHHQRLRIPRRLPRESEYWEPETRNLEPGRRFVHSAWSWLWGPGPTPLKRERIFIELTTSDRKLKASREGSKRGIYGTLTT